MKTICDLNIWRKWEKREIDENKQLPISSQLVATYINIFEFANSNLLFSDYKTARNVIRIIMKVPAYTIFDNPFMYLIKLDDPNFTYDVEKENEFILQFTTLIANDNEIKDEKLLREIISKNKEPLKEFTRIANELAQEVKSKILNYKEHRKNGIIESNRLLISKMVEINTKKKLSPDFDWNKIEFFENVFKEFTLEMETNGKKMTENDLADLFQLIYVQPGDKFWTTDKPLIQYIRKANMDKYLISYGV